MQHISMILRCFMLTLLVLTTSSCRPQGQWNRIIHPPHQAYLKGPEALGATALESLSQPGLPQVCRDYRYSELVCLECRVDVWLIQRCFAHSGKIEPQIHCRSTPDAVKCLTPEPIQVLTLSLRRPEERILAENFETWRATVRNIWFERLSPAEGEELEVLLSFLQSLTSMLSEGRPEQWDRGLILDLMAHDDALFPAEEKILEQCWDRLQKLKLEGHLTLPTVLQQSQDMLSQLGVESRRLNYLDALNLEGLEGGL